MSVRRLLSSVVLLGGLLGLTAAPARAQVLARQKYYLVTGDRAVSVTRTVLVGRGYSVVRIDRVGPTHVVYYRVKHARRGKVRMQRLVIRTVQDRVMFEDTEPSVLVDI